jgi:hypothetical protein
MLPIEWKRLVEKFEKAIQKATDSEQENRKRDQNLIAGPLNSLNDQFVGYIQQQDTGDRSKRAREIATTWGIFLTAGFTLITAGIFYCQLRVFERSDRIFERTLVATNRAWLAPTHLEFAKSIEASDGPIILVHFRNVGHSPALDLKTSGGWFPAKITKTVENGFPEVFPTWEQINATIHAACEQNKPIPDGQSVFPDETWETNTIVTAPKNPPDKAAITAGSEAIIVVGCLTYNSFDEMRHTGFCRYASKSRTGQVEFLSCPAGNFAK